MSVLRLAFVMQGGLGWIGGGEYVKNLILAVRSASDARNRSPLNISVLSDGPIAVDIAGELRPHVDSFYTRDVDYPRPSMINRAKWKMDKMRGTIDPQLEEFVNNMGFQFIYPYLSGARINRLYRSAAWIADFQHSHLPDMFSEFEAMRRDNTFRQIAQFSPIVVLSSISVLKDFESSFSFALDRVKLLRFCTIPQDSWFLTDPIQTQMKYGLPDAFFLISNQFWKHKNHLVVFEAIRQLKLKCVKPMLVCTGHINDYRHPEFSDVILSSIHRMGIANQVFLLGLIPKADQMQLMRRSIAVIQPSLFEGWSTLVEDARSLGKPMILSDLPVHKEQAPPDSNYFDRHSPEALACMIEEYLGMFKPGPDLRAESEARVASRSRIVEYGSEFLNIARGQT